MPPDPYTSTREEWTSSLVDIPAPPSPPAKDKYIAVFKSLQNLIKILARHTAMAPNLQQTYMTPAASKNKIYFMWDFWGRTLGMIMSVNPALPRAEKDDWAEMKARVAYGMRFMNNGALADEMNGAAHKGTYEIKDYGPDVMQAVAELEGYGNNM